MQADFLAPPQKARTRLIAAFAAGLVVLAAVVVLATRAHSTEPDHRASDGQAPAAPTATVPVTISPSTTIVAAAAANPVQLVEGARHVNGVAVGYLRTMAGAVSAAVEYTVELGSNLDFDRAEQIGAAVEDPRSGRSAAFYAQGVAVNRKGMGLPVTGAVPIGASLSAGPVSYQLRDESTDRVTVLLLCYLTWITPATGMHNVVIVVPVPMVWAQGDWKQTRRPAGSPDYAELRYQPGSTEAVAAGWLPLTA